MEQWAHTQLQAGWLAWAGAAVVAALLTGALVWTGWKIRGLWAGFRMSRRAGRRPATASGAGGREGATAAAGAAAAPVRQAVGMEAYRRQVRSVPDTAPPSVESAAGGSPAAATGAGTAAQGTAAAMLEELLDRLHRVAVTLEEIQDRRRTVAVAGHEQAGPAWDLEFVNRRD